MSSGKHGKQAPLPDDFKDPDETELYVTAHHDVIYLGYQSCRVLMLLTYPHILSFLLIILGSIWNSWKLCWGQSTKKQFQISCFQDLCVGTFCYSLRTPTIKWSGTWSKSGYLNMWKGPSVQISVSSFLPFSLFCPGVFFIGKFHSGDSDLNVIVVVPHLSTGRLRLQTLHWTGVRNWNLSQGYPMK